MKVTHPLKAIYDKDSQVLILGTMPSQKSREQNFYYAHPKNRFWPTLAKVYKESIPNNISAKEAFLKKHHIALFDVLKSCDITSSADNSIKNPQPNDIKPILTTANIKAIFTTGKKAYHLYQKYLYPKTNIEAIYLPSTSPANCPKDIEIKLYQAYSQIKEITDNKI